MIAAPAVIGSVCALVLLARRRGIRPDSLTGKDRTTVAGRLGSPAASARGQDDETWYYRPAGEARLAMAVRFERGVVTDVQWVRPPR